jgi:hypothetical protein
MDELMDVRFNPARNGFRGEDADKLFNRQSAALQSQLDALLAQQAAQPAERIEWAPTGRTIAKEFNAQDLAGQRAMIASFYSRIAVRKATSKAPGLDVSRLDIETAEDIGLDPVQTVAAGVPVSSQPRNKQPKRPNSAISAEPTSATAA